MNILYCPKCGEYLMGTDGECQDCHCGWKQERKDKMNRREFVKNMFSLAAAPVVLQAASKLPAPEKLAECKDDTFPASIQGTATEFDPEMIKDLIKTFEENYIKPDERWLIVSPEVHKAVIRNMPMQIRFKKRLLDLQKIITGHESSKMRWQGVKLYKTTELEMI